ncbi:MAG: hypothetical protein LCH76_13520 [Actinobacteria bacterium]|nr:hypothetical protein [Actinomycetota bacterium]
MTQPPYRPPFDPTKPLGPQQHNPTEIHQFAPPRSRLPWLLGLGAVLVAVAIILTATFADRILPAPQPSASPTPASTSAKPSGQPFVTPDGRVDGRWEVTDTRWNDEGVEVNVRVAVERGSLRFSFMAFTNDAAEVLYPQPTISYPEMATAQPIASGEEREGWVFFPTYRSDLTLILATDAGRQISALLVRA